MNILENKLPKVSILIAARNEEAAILRCLLAFDALKYPKDLLEIWIGNDQSTDATEDIVKEFIREKPYFNYLYINTEIIHLKGKTNVLEQLAHKATGKYLFYCDADIAVKPDWVNQMLALFQPSTGVVVGITRMTPSGMFAGLQSLEWLFSLAAMRLFSFIKIPFTGMGNNMAVTREAYFKVGGYEKIGFSIVEDFALFTAILECGYTFTQGFDERILSVSLPAQTLPELLQQRKRWVNGAMNAPFLIRLSFYLSAIFLPVLILVAFLYPTLALWAGCIHYLLVLSISLTSTFILKQKDLFIFTPVFWLYFNLNNSLMLINHLIPSPTIWKGRKY